MHLKDFLFAVINFVILFGALFFITRKMIARMFKERRAKIAAALDEAKAAEEKKMKPGRDFNIISYNESPINDIILNGLTTISTDFAEMGRRKTF